MVARNFLQTDAMLDEEIVRLQALASSPPCRRPAARILEVEMEHWASNASSARCSPCLRANPGSVEIFDARQLPLDYWRTPPAPEPTPDKKMIADALKSGTDCTRGAPGAKEQARGFREVHHDRKAAFSVTEFMERHGIERHKFYDEVKSGRLRTYMLGASAWCRVRSPTNGKPKLK